MLILGFWFFLTINPHNNLIQVLRTLADPLSHYNVIFLECADISSSWCGALLSTQCLCCTSYRLLRWDALPTRPTLCLLTLRKMVEFLKKVRSVDRTD